MQSGDGTQNARQEEQQQQQQQTDVGALRAKQTLHPTGLAAMAPVAAMATRASSAAVTGAAAAAPQHLAVPVHAPATSPATAASGCFTLMPQLSAPDCTRLAAAAAAAKQAADSCSSPQSATGSADQPPHRVLFCSCEACKAYANKWLEKQQNQIDAKAAGQLAAAAAATGEAGAAAADAARLEKNNGH